MRSNIIVIFLLSLFLITCYAENNKDNFDINKVRKELKSANYSVNDTVNNLKSDNKANTDSAFIIVVRIFVYLLIVIALLALLVWILKKSGLNKSSSLSGNGEVIDVVSLGNGKNIIVVRVYDFVYILAFSSGNVAVIDKFEGEKALEIIARSGGNESITGFKKVLDNFMEKFTAENGEK